MFRRLSVTRHNVPGSHIRKAFVTPLYSDVKILYCGKAKTTMNGRMPLEAQAQIRPNSTK